MDLGVRGWGRQERRTRKSMTTRLLCTLAAWLVSKTMRPGLRYGADSLRWGILRALIKERDGYKCRECGRKAEYGGVWLECHHIKPVSAGGGYGPRNLRMLCKDCHGGRHGK